MVNLGEEISGKVMSVPGVSEAAGKHSRVRVDFTACGFLPFTLVISVPGLPVLVLEYTVYCSVLGQITPYQVAKV